MVVRVHDESTDQLFRALGDSTRRDIVRRSIQADHSISGLSRNYEMSFAAVQKHVAVLERVGLVTKHTHGREQLVRSNIDAIRAAQTLLDEFEDLWRGRIDRFEDILDETRKGGTE